MGTFFWSIVFLQVLVNQKLKTLFPDKQDGHAFKKKKQHESVLHCYNNSCLIDSLNDMYQHVLPSDSIYSFVYVLSTHSV